MPDYLTAVDLCCGVGGWACAARDLPIRFLAVADLAADCLETWQLNHGRDHPDCVLVQADLATPEGMQSLFDSLRADGPGRAWPVDLVLGAIPCEQISAARGGKPCKPGEMEAVHALLDACLDAVRRLRPRWWCFEDVTAVEKLLPGPLFAGMPYECRRVNAAEYGPQKRLRTFFGAFPPLAPARPGPRTLGEVLRPGPYRTLSNAAGLKRSRSKWYGSDACRELVVEDPAPTITAAPGVSSNNDRGLMVPVEPARFARVLDPGCGKNPPIELAGPNSGLGGRVQEPESPAFTVLSSSMRRNEQVRQPSAQGRLLDASEPAASVTASASCDHREVAEGGLARVMEWQEAATLQGFPTDFLFVGSLTRTWKFIAQAIPIQVGMAILGGIVAAAKLRR